MWKVTLNKYTWDFDGFDNSDFEEWVNEVNEDIESRVTTNEDDIDSLSTTTSNNSNDIWWLNSRIETLENSSNSFEEWQPLNNNTYLYVIYWVDDDWRVERFLRTTMLKSVTDNSSWVKPTTLAGIEWLTYN